ncbi:Ig-like domain-containing protein [Pseudarthrobacter sp. W1I19]|uniref:Ig-like domain-containing protein n=1 Tax=Pseudarthrobacter sp. W1I19 TaxID=3042288 RepID=UPI0027D78CA7|nr:Ig-like domain-containing protein [Pseudarthrobacter sp. W1I19]
MLTALLVALAALVVPGVASAALPDVGVQGPSHTGTLEPTGTKRATSALWFNDGSWWGNLWDTASQDFHIFRFNTATSTWADTGVVTETRADTHHDVLWDGNTLYVASYKFVNDGLPAQAGFPTTMRRYSYNTTTDKYTLLGSEKINDNKVETLTIDKDSKGRLWATWQQGNRIYLNATGTDGVTWGTPFPHPDASLSSVSVDDTSAVIAFDGKIGVMWSRQVGNSTDGMYWSIHEDTAAPKDGWSNAKPAVSGLRTGDDHMNLKWLDSTSNGKVFAAIKTSNTSSSLPLIQLLALDTTTALWSKHTIATVAECPNRVIVLIDEAAQQIRTFATYPKSGTGITNAGVCTSSGGAIYEKSTSLTNISFSTAKTKRIMDADQYVHNVTSTKQNLNNATSTANSGLLVLADVNATKTYWHFYEEGPGGTGGGTADTTPPTVTSTSPTPGATNVAVNTNVTATLSEAVDPSTNWPASFTLTGPTGAVPAGVTYNSTSRIATLDPTSDLAANTMYTAKISGVKDVAGNGMADKTWTFTTAAATTPPPTGTPDTVTLTATADTYASSASPTTNFGTSTMLGVDFSPVEVAYLKFSLPAAPAGKTLQSATLQLKSAGSGSTGTQNIKLVADDTWTETGITSNSRPALGASLGRLGPTSVNTDYNVVLDAAAVGGELGQSLSLGLDSASSDGLDLNSRETASPPKLVLTFQ